MDRETRSQSSCDTEKSHSMCHKRQRSSVSTTNSNSSSGKTTTNNSRKRRRISCDSHNDNDDDILKLDPIEDCVSPYTNGGGNGHQNQNGFSHNNNSYNNSHNNFNKNNNNFKNNNNNRNNYNNNNFNNRSNNNNFNNQNNQNKNNNWYHKNQQRYNNNNNQPNSPKTNPNRPHFIPFQQRIAELQDRLSEKEIQLKESKIDVMNRESDITELKIQHERESIEIEKIHCRKMKEMQIKEAELMQIHKDEVTKIKLALENKRDIIAKLRKELEDARNENLVTRAILETTNNRNVELTGRIAELVDIKKKNMSNKKTQTELRAVSIEVQVDSLEIDTETKKFLMSPPQSTVVHSTTKTEHPLSRLDTPFNRNDSSDSGVSLARSESQISIEMDHADATKSHSQFLTTHKDNHNKLIKFFHKKSPKNSVRQNLTINIDGTKSDDYVMVDYIESPDEMPGKGLMMDIGGDFEEELMDTDGHQATKIGSQTDHEKLATLSQSEKSREAATTESNFENLRVFSNGTKDRYEDTDSQLQQDLLKFKKILKESKLGINSSEDSSQDSKLNLENPTNKTPQKEADNLTEILSDFKDILGNKQESVDKSLENSIKFATKPSGFLSDYSDFSTSSTEGITSLQAKSTELSTSFTGLYPKFTESSKKSTEISTKPTDLVTKSLEFSKNLTDLYASSTDLSVTPSDSPRNIKFFHEIYTDNSESSTGFESRSKKFDESSKKLLEKFSKSHQSPLAKDLFKSPSKTYELSPRIYSLPPSTRGSSLDLSKALSDSTDNLSMTSELQDFMNLSESEPTDEPQPSMQSISEADFLEFAQKFKEKFKQNKIQKAARELLYIPIIPCYTNDIKKPSESVTEAVSNKFPLNNQNTQNKRRSKSNDDDSHKATIDKNNQSCTSLPAESIKSENDVNVSENDTDIDEIHDSIVLSMIKRESGDESYDGTSSISSHCTTNADYNVTMLENKLTDKIMNDKNVIDKELRVSAEEIKFNCGADKGNEVDVQSEVEGHCTDVSLNLTAQMSTDCQQDYEVKSNECQRQISAKLEDLEETIKILEGGTENLATELEIVGQSESFIKENTEMDAKPDEQAENLTKVLTNSEHKMLNNSEKVDKICENSSKLKDVVLDLGKSSENAAKDSKSPIKISQNFNEFTQNSSKFHQNSTNHEENLANVTQNTAISTEIYTNSIPNGQNMANTQSNSSSVAINSAHQTQNSTKNVKNCASTATNLPFVASSSTNLDINQASINGTSTESNSMPQTQKSEFPVMNNASLTTNSESSSQNPLTLPQTLSKPPQIPKKLPNLQQKSPPKTKPQSYPSNPKKIRKIDDDCPSYLHSFQDFLSKSCVVIKPKVHRSVNLSVPIITPKEDREEFYKELQQKQKAGKIVKRRESILVDNRRNKRQKMETRSGSKQHQNDKLSKAVEKLKNIANGTKNPELEVGKESSFNLSDNLLDIRIQPRFVAEYQLNNGHMSSGTSQLITGTSQGSFSWFGMGQTYPWTGQIGLEVSQVGTAISQVGTATSQAGFVTNQLGSRTSQVAFEANQADLETCERNTMAGQVNTGFYQVATEISQVDMRSSLVDTKLSEVDSRSSHLNAISSHVEAFSSQVGAISCQLGTELSQISNRLSQAGTEISQMNLLTNQLSKDTLLSKLSSNTTQAEPIAVQLPVQQENHQAAPISSSIESISALKYPNHQSSNIQTSKITYNSEFCAYESPTSYTATNNASKKESSDLKSRILMLQADKLAHKQDHALENVIRRQLELPELPAVHPKLSETHESQFKQSETLNNNLKSLNTVDQSPEALSSQSNLPETPSSHPNPLERHVSISETLKTLSSAHMYPEIPNVIHKPLEMPINQLESPNALSSEPKQHESLPSIPEDHQIITSQADCNSTEQTSMNQQNLSMTQSQSSETLNFEAELSKTAVDLSITCSVTQQDSKAAQNDSNSNEIEAKKSPTESVIISPLNLIKSREEFRSLTPEYRGSPCSSGNDFEMSPVESFTRKRGSPSKKSSPSKSSKSPFKVDSKKPRNLPSEDEMGVCSQIVATTLKKSQQQREMSRSSEERMLQNGSFQGYSRNEQFYGYRNERVDSGFNPDRNSHNNRYQPRNERERRNSVHDSVHSRQNDRKQIDRSVSLISQDLRPKSPKYSRSNSYQESQFKTNSRTPLTIPFRSIKEPADQPVTTSPPAVLNDEQSIKRAQNKNEISQLVIAELTVFYELKKFESDNPKELFKSMARAITYHFHDKNPDMIPSKNAIKNYVMEVFYNYGTIRSEKDFLLSEDYDDD